MLSTYPGLVWIGLDEKFNHENPAETKRKFTSTFNPLNEKWFSDMNQLLEELEAEPEREIETSGPQKVEPTICHPTKEGKEVQGSGEGAEGKASEVEQVAEAKPIEITVPRRFLRFMNRSIVTFEEFASSCTMYRFYQYKSQEFCSPSHIGRLCAKGYLVFIFKVHESGYYWNGEYTEDNMFVVFERVDGLCIGGTNFFIRQPTYQGFNKDKGKEDLRTFMKFLFPHYLPAKGSQLPWYFAQFVTDIEEMPDLEDPPLKWEIFRLYMTNHFFSKAPLVRLTLVSNVYRVCDSEIVHVDRTQRKPRFKLLDEEMMRFKADIGDWLEDLSHPLKKSYERSRIETHYDHNRWTCWDAIELGRHCEQHGMDHTKDNGVQEMLDPEVIDLMLEQDLRGLLADAIKMIIQKTQFIGRLGAIWEQFCENEPHDDRTRIPYLSGEIQVPVAVEAEEQPALRISKYQSREEEVNQEFGY